MRPAFHEKTQAGIKYAWHSVIDAGGMEVWHGNCKIYHQNGQLMEDGEYVFGKKCGIWRVWHDNGNLAEEGKLLDGVDDGEWMYWRRYGSLAERGNWKLGLAHGTWEVHLKLGRMLIGEWRDGERWNGECYTNGRYTKHTDGVLLIEGTLLDIFDIADADEELR